jgi:hypothetical protein
MKTTPPVLIVDDGELDDIREILAELEVEFALLRGGAIPDKVGPPSRLFLATPRRALLAQLEAPKPGAARCASASWPRTRTRCARCCAASASTC